MNIGYYLPILREYYRKFWDKKELSGYDQESFVPYVFGRYIQSPLRIFYIGRDTYYWCKAREMKSMPSDLDIQNYLRENADSMGVEKIPSWGNATSFWGTVTRLQLLIRTGKYCSDITSLSNKLWSIVEEVGYGNLNSLELESTIKQKQETEIVDKSLFAQMHDCAYNLTLLSGIMKAYSPDICIVLTCTGDDSELYELGYKRLADFDEAPFRAIYINDDSGKIVIWSNHPSNYSWKQTNMEEMCFYLYDSLKSAIALLSEDKREAYKCIV